jgi:hypothetical protein
MSVNGILAGVLEHVSSQMLQQNQSLKPKSLNELVGVRNERFEANRNAGQSLARPS